MIRTPKPNERVFVRNTTEHSVSFAPHSLVVIKRGGGVWVDEHWASFDAFRHDPTVMALSRRNRVSISYRPDWRIV